MAGRIRLPPNTRVPSPWTNAPAIRFVLSTTKTAEMPYANWNGADPYSEGRPLRRHNLPKNRIRSPEAVNSGSIPIPIPTTRFISLFIAGWIAETTFWSIMCLDKGWWTMR